MKTTVKEITPAYANLILKKNEHNRRMRENIIIEYAGAMRRGEWALNGAPIVIHQKTGKLLDGQHRLSACVRANVNFITVVTFIDGDDKSIFGTLDRGKRRSAIDLVRLDGHLNDTLIVSIIRVLHTWANNVKALTPDKKLTDMEISEVANKYNDIVKAAHNAAVCQKIRKMHLLPPSVLGACYALFSHSDEHLCNLFMDSLETGSGLSSKDPIYILREMLIRIQSRSLAQRGSGLMSNYWTLAVMIKAYNAFLLKKPVKTIKFTDNEGFPEILKPDGTFVKRSIYKFR